MLSCRAPFCRNADIHMLISCPHQASAMAERAERSRWSTGLLVCLAFYMGAMFSPGSPLSGSRTHQHISVMQSSVQHSDENLALSDSDAELYALLKTAAALAQPGIENTVMVAEVNDGFFPMAHNLYLQLQNVTPPVANILWVALDAKALAKVKATFIAPLVYHDLTSTFEESSTKFRTASYNKIVKHKWTLLQRVLELGFNTLIDVDFAVLRNPFVYLHSMQTMCDLTMYEERPLPAIHGQTSWEKRNQHLLNPEVNTGFLLIKSSPNAKDLVRDFIAAPEQQGMDDQTLFNVYMKQRSGTQESNLLLPMKDKNTRCGNWKGVSLRLLSPVIVGSWRQYYEFKLADWTQETPCAIHFNWLSGFEAKKKKMAAFGYWFTDQAKAE